MKRLVVAGYSIHLKKEKLKPDKFRIGFLTDLHNCESGSHNELLLNTIEGNACDLILCGGDMIIGKAGYSVEIGRDFMLDLAKKNTVYSALGNHEFRSKVFPDQYPGIYDAYTVPLKEAGVIFLEGEKKDIVVKGVPIELFGYEAKAKFYKKRHTPRMTRDDLTMQLGNPDREKISVLLAHNPTFLSAYQDWNADIILCGHNHGGMIRFGEKRGILTPGLQLFSELAHGYHQKGNTHAVISAGLGEHTVPIRFNNPREFVVIDVYINC